MSMKISLGSHNLSLSIFVANEHENVDAHLLICIFEALLSKCTKFVMCNTVQND